MAQTSYQKLTQAQMNTLLSSTLGSLKPYQIDQVQEYLSKLKILRGPMSDVSVESTLTTIVGTHSGAVNV